MSEVVPVPQRTRSPGRVGGSEPRLAGDTGDRGVKLSILMPVFNEERTIVRAVEEVLLTPYPCDFELIVVDDGSTDETGVLLARHAS